MAIKKLLFLPLIILLFQCNNNVNIEPSPTGIAPLGQDAGKWRLTFEDDFTGTQLDESKWSIGYGWGDRTDWTREIIHKDYVKVNNGVLQLIAAPIGSGDFWAGAVNTKDKFFQQFGYYEARIKAAPGRGILTAWWGKRNTEEWPPEIDIAEIFGAVNPNGDPTLGPWKVSTNIHFKTSAEGEKQEDQTFISLPEDQLFTEDFHVFAVEWNSQVIIWYLDGTEIARSSKGAGHVTGQFYWILNQHICSKHIEWPGCPDEDNTWPSITEVDYVRAWRLN